MAELALLNVNGSLRGATLYRESNFEGRRLPLTFRARPLGLCRTFRMMVPCSSVLQCTSVLKRAEGVEGGAILRDEAVHDGGYRLHAGDGRANLPYKYFAVLHVPLEDAAARSAHPEDLQ